MKPSRAITPETSQFQESETVPDLSDVREGPEDLTDLDEDRRPTLPLTDSIRPTDTERMCWNWAPHRR